jgi:NAD(P)-dependent dehydrogenase (short-subunit alcohol dehydrogenase family)
MRFWREEDIAGNIVNVSSLAGIKGMQRFAGFAAYAASKHAVVGLTEALALEGKPYGIRVNAIAPGTLGPMLYGLGENALADVGCARTFPTYNARGDRPHGGVLARPNPFRRALRRHHRDPLQ